MMSRGTLINIALLIGAAIFFFSSPRLRSLVGLNSSEPITIQTVSSSDAEPQEQSYELITLLPKDGIPSINDPQFVSGAEADAQYSPDELVLGVEIDGDARAYSIPFLNGHEIVNDVVGGEPIAVTW